MIRTLTPSCCKIVARTVIAPPGNDEIEEYFWQQAMRYEIFKSPFTSIRKFLFKSASEVIETYFANNVQIHICRQLRCVKTNLGLLT